MNQKERIGLYLKKQREIKKLTTSILEERPGLRKKTIEGIENASLNYTIDKLLIYIKKLWK